MSKKTESHHVQLDTELVKLVKLDAKHFKKSKDGITEAALRNLFSLKREYRAEFYKYLPKKTLGRPIAAFAVLLCSLSCALASPIIDASRLADSIRVEEGANPRFLYGIHHKGSGALCEAVARKRCIETIYHAERDFNRRLDFITFLSKRYCPVNAESWASNVRKIYNKSK